MNLQSVPRSFTMLIFVTLLQFCSATSLDGISLQFNKRGELF
jgi:hypothetical protein